MDLSTITVEDFKAYFSRDFSYGVTNDYVTDNDINKAFNEAKLLINLSILGSDEQITICYYYLTAHYLCHDLKTAVNGLESTGDNPVTARSVGSVSESYTIPELYTKNPQIAFIAKTGYGQKYLSIVLPLLVGNFSTISGGTQP